MKRCLSLFIFFLVAWQQVSSQGVADHSLNGDIRPVRPQQSTVFENNSTHENAGVKTIKNETIPGKSLLHEGNLLKNQLPKPMEDVAESIYSRDNGPTISPKEASTTSRAPNISPESTTQIMDDGPTISPRGTSIKPPHMKGKSTLPILLVDSGQNMSPAETSTMPPSIADEIAAITKETSATLSNIEDGSTHPNQLVDTAQNISPKETSTRAPSIADKIVSLLLDNGHTAITKETFKTLPNIEDESTHANQVIDTSTRQPSIADKISMQLPVDIGQGISSKKTSTKASLEYTARASLVKTPQQNVPPETPDAVASVNHSQIVDNIQNSNTGTSTMPQAEAEHLQMDAERTEMPGVGQPTQHIPLGDNVDDGDSKGTSAPDPALTLRVTPAPIFMLDAGQLTKPNIKIQTTTKITQGESSTSGTQATPSIEPKVSTDSEINNPDFPSHSGTEFTTTIPHQEQKLFTDDEKKVPILIPHNAGESTHPLLKLEQETKIPPSPLPGLYSDLKTRQFKVRRKKRSANDEYPEHRQTDCQENVSMFPKSYIWGVIGWACFLVLLWLYLNQKLSIWATIVKLVSRRRDQNPQDVESGPQPNPEDNEEIKIYEKKGRSPSGYGIFKINEDYIEFIDESYLTQGLVNLPLLVPHLPTAENPEMVLDKMRTFQRRASEKVKVIRRLSSYGFSTLEDQILLAKEVISDHVGDDAKVSEKRKVIREVTANERKGSLRDEIEFARSVILPSDVVKEQDEDAMHRRQQIKAQTSGRRTSLLEEISVAKEVLGVVDDVAP